MSKFSSATSCSGTSALLIRRSNRSPPSSSKRNNSRDKTPPNRPRRGLLGSHRRLRAVLYHRKSGRRKNVQSWSRQKMSVERRNLYHRARCRHSNRYHKADEEALPRQHQRMLGLVVRNSLSADRNTICSIVRWSRSTVLHSSARDRRLDHRGSDTQFHLERCKCRCRCRGQCHRQLPWVHHRCSQLSRLRHRAARVPLRRLQGQACVISHQCPQYRHKPHYLNLKHRQ